MKSRQRRVHQLKCRQEYFRQIVNKKKKFEVRKNDRDFKVGQVLELYEVDDRTRPTGLKTSVLITYMMSDDMHPGINIGYCVLGIELLN